MNTFKLNYRSSDDELFVGDTADEVVQAMADTKFTKPKSLAAYRRATSKRIKRLFGVEIPTENSESFLAGLCDAGLLKNLANVS